MRAADLDYSLPPELVASHPANRRDEARLMVVTEPTAHLRVSDLVELIDPGSLLVVNDTKVTPARLLGQKPSGGKVELLLLERLDDGRFSAFGRASRPLREGTRVIVGEELELQVEASADELGRVIVCVHEGPAGEALDRALEIHGEVPLPPYLGRAAEPSDRERYQTVYARVPGAVAAPTAGLHFTEELLAALERRGVERASVTLHVGPGTFRPVTSVHLGEHPMHAERMEVPEAAVQAVAAARRRGGAVVAVGTTVVRALESAAASGELVPTRGETCLMIQPGYPFRVVDRLLTNFHLPRSTLLALVYAFAGMDTVRRAYQVAIAERYRFYSYGDAMLLGRPS